MAKVAVRVTLAIQYLQKEVILEFGVYVENVSIEHSVYLR